jgi:hypothetical protein
MSNIITTIKDASRIHKFDTSNCMIQIYEHQIHAIVLQTDCEYEFVFHTDENVIGFTKKENGHVINISPYF